MDELTRLALGLACLIAAVGLGAVARRRFRTEDGGPADMGLD